MVEKVDNCLVSFSHLSTSSLALLLGAKYGRGQRLLEGLFVGLVEDDIDEWVDDAEHPPEGVHRDVESGIVLSMRICK